MINTSFETSEKLRSVGCEMRGEFGWYESVETHEMIALSHRDAHHQKYRFVCEALLLDQLLQWLESYCESEVVLKLSNDYIEVQCPAKNITQRLARSFNDVEDVGQIIIGIVSTSSKV